MADKTLTCITPNCPEGGTFNFTEREQKFFASKGFADPIRCPTCRHARRAMKEKQMQHPERSNRNNRDY